MSACRRGGLPRELIPARLARSQARPAPLGRMTDLKRTSEASDERLVVWPHSIRRLDRIDRPALPAVQDALHGEDVGTQAGLHGGW